jgi:Uma2 family endonuclease
MSTAYKEKGDFPRKSRNLGKSKVYTYADVLEWDESVRAEIINGEIFMMAPPSTAHQDISREIFMQLCNFLKGKTCRAYAAPFGVRLFPKKNLSDDTLVEPDIVVVCDKSKIDKRGCDGAPDMIVEILSPSSVRHDQMVKFRLYQKAGVKEYWIVNGENRVLYVHTLLDGNYVTTVYDESDDVPVSVLPGCVIPLKEVFEQN